MKNKDDKRNEICMFMLLEIFPLNVKNTFFKYLSKFPQNLSAKESVSKSSQFYGILF